jgi:hypothetical protein
MSTCAILLLFSLESLGEFRKEIREEAEGEERFPMESRKAFRNWSGDELEQ